MPNHIGESPRPRSKKVFLVDNSNPSPSADGLLSDAIEKKIDCQRIDCLTTSLRTTHGMWYDQGTNQHHEISFASPNVRDDDGMTPLLQAVSKGLTKSVRHLCDDYAVDTLAKDALGRTVLHLGAQRGEIGLFRFLLQRSGVSIDAVDDGGRTVLFYAAQHERAALLSELLHSYDVSADVQDRSGRTALSYACEYNSYRALELLLEAGAEYISEDHTRMTPLHYAVKSGHFAVTKRLIEHTKNGNPALQLAGRMGQSKIEERLMILGRDVANWTDENLRDLLIRSAHDGRDVIVRRILHIHEVGANVRDGNGRTPLSHAAEMDHQNIIRILLRRGASHIIEDKKGRLPQDYAQQNGNTICQRLLNNCQKIRV
jgi:ankyrin repeat protein